MNLADWPHLHRPAVNPHMPALLLLHGTGGTERDLVNFAEKVAPGALLVAPRGRVSENGAARFFARLAEGVFDPAEVKARARELAEFVRTAHQAYAPQAPGFYALGFSNGANVAAALLQFEPDAPLLGGVLLRPMVVIQDTPPPGSLKDRRVLLLNGAQDPIVPVEHPALLARLLRSAGATAHVVVHPHATHGLTGEDILQAKSFFASSAG